MLAKKSRSADKVPANLDTEKVESRDIAKDTKSSRKPGPTGKELAIAGCQEDERDGVSKSLEEELASTAKSGAGVNSEHEIDESSMGLRYTKMLKFLTNIKAYADFIDSYRLDDFKHRDVYRDVKHRKHPRGPFPKNRVQKRMSKVTTCSTIGLHPPTCTRSTPHDQ